MKAEAVREAAILLEELEKLESALKHMPPNADTLTLTFRKGSKSKSISLKNGIAIQSIKDVVHDTHYNMQQRIYDLGVSLGEPEGE